MPNAICPEPFVIMCLCDGICVVVSVVEPTVPLILALAVDCLLYTSCTLRYIRSPMAGSTAFTVMVICLTPISAISFAASGRARPLLDRQSSNCGSVLRISRSVSKVSSRLASGSPGPAMPATDSPGRRAAARTVSSQASSGERSTAVTPGRLNRAYRGWRRRAGRRPDRPCPSGAAEPRG